MKLTFALPDRRRLRQVTIDALGCMALSLQQLMAFGGSFSVRSSSILIGVEQLGGGWCWGVSGSELRAFDFWAT